MHGDEMIRMWIRLSGHKGALGQVFLMNEEKGVMFLIQTSNNGSSGGCYRPPGRLVATILHTTFLV
jgi:hypothetical protein